MIIALYDSVRRVNGFPGHKEMRTHTNHDSDTWSSVDR